MNYNSGDILIYYKKGQHHIHVMDSFIGKIVTIRGVYENEYYGRPFVTVMEDRCSCYFDTGAMRPVMSTIR